MCVGMCINISTHTCEPTYDSITPAYTRAHTHVHMRVHTHVHAQLSRSPSDAATPFLTRGERGLDGSGMTKRRSQMHGRVREMKNGMCGRFRHISLRGI